MMKTSNLLRFPLAPMQLISLNRCIVSNCIVMQSSARGKLLVSRPQKSNKVSRTRINSKIVRPRCFDAVATTNLIKWQTHNFVKGRGKKFHCEYYGGISLSVKFECYFFSFLLKIF